MIGERPPGAASRGKSRKQATRQSSRKSRRTERLERRARQRRARARAHLDRALGKVAARSVARRPRYPRHLPKPLRQLLLVGIFTSSLIVGALWAKPLLVAVSAWWASEPVMVTSVAVQGTVRLSPNEVARTLGVASGLPVDRIDTEALVRRLTGHAWIAHARATVLPNGSLIVRVDERIPVATLRAGAEQPAFLVDATGAVFARADGEITEGLLRLRRAAVPVVLNHAADAVLARGAEIAGRIAQREIASLTGASLQLPDPSRREGWVVRSASGELKVVLGEQDDRELEARLDRLESLLEADLWAGPPAGRIDLRFAERAILHASVDL